MSLINAGNIGKIRKIYRLTLEDMGALIGVSGVFISYVERGHRNLSSVKAIALQRELDLTPDKLERLIKAYDETLIGVRK